MPVRQHRKRKSANAGNYIRGGPITALYKFFTGELFAGKSLAARDRAHRAHWKNSWADSFYGD
jgi:hypothetical protein